MHGTDVADAVGLAWSPPTDVAAAVLARLFPGTDPGAEPMAVLLWATGRADLPGRPRRTAWTYAMTPAGDSG
ncbi:hypothetical protein [Blastococcus deserti]|uniref:Uncharacterized protein n=1 Tax=Blastococcus deserti TaxID=2259033 RepID=A0ABW4XEW5_9ACTN